MSDEFENDNQFDESRDGYESDEYEQDQYDDPSQDYYDDQQYDDSADQAGDDGYDDSYDYGDEPDDGGSSGGGKRGGDAPKVSAKMRREWENEITTNKKVKREEMRRKLKRAMLFMLVFALVVTSIVYVMLLFIQENNVRITASSKNNDNSISLSFGDNYWTPYLNAQGPTQIWDVSYSPLYDRERLDTTDEVRAMLMANSVPVGTNNGENFIRFIFMLRNNGAADVTVDYEMTLGNDKDSGLQNAVRVMWGESFKNPEYIENPDEGDDPTRTDVTIYAAKSNNQRLANTGINVNADPEEGYLEYIAYPVGSDDPSYDLQEDFFAKIGTPDGMSYDDANQNGFIQPTMPFEGTDVVFSRTTTLTQGDIMYCYVCIWLEGSDFDCVDSAIGGYVRLGINFIAY